MATVEGPYRNVPVIQPSYLTLIGKQHSTQFYWEFPTTKSSQNFGRGMLVGEEMDAVLIVSQMLIWAYTD